MVGDLNSVGFGGNMNKEQLAKNWAYEWLSESEYNSRRDDLEDGFSAGWDRGQKQLLSEAAKDFEDWWMQQPVSDFDGVDAGHVEGAWQAAKLSSAAELAGIEHAKKENDCTSERINKLSKKIDRMKKELEEIARMSLPYEG